jgi:hypothetical protein
MPDIAIDFAGMLNQSFVLSPYQSNGGKSATYGTGTTYSCYVRYKRKSLANECSSIIWIYCSGAVPATMRDKVTFDGQSYPIQEIVRLVDETGDQYALIIYI